MDDPNDRYVIYGRVGDYAYAVLDGQVVTIYAVSGFYHRVNPEGPISQGIMDSPIRWRDAPVVGTLGQAHRWCREKSGDVTALEAMRALDE